MSIAESVIMAAAALLAPARRDEQKEAWQADLRDCTDLGFTPSTIVRGAICTALSVSNLRANFLHHTTQPRESTMHIIRRSDAIRLAVALMWTLASIAVLVTSIDHLQQSGSNLGYTFASGGAAIEIIPIAICVGTAALLVGIGYAALTIRRGQVASRRSTSNI